MRYRKYFYCKRRIACIYIAAYFMKSGHEHSESYAADAVLRASFKRMFPDASPSVSLSVFKDVLDMFEGRYLNCQASDTPYHNLQHTLQVLRCYNGIMEGWHLSGIEPRLTPRQYELGAIAVLFHDTGYLKFGNDTGGTGAKYTFTHVLRSCACASSCLPRHAVTLAEIDSILAMIRCTAFTHDLHNFSFQEPMESILGCAVTTADYLGQMAAPDYPEALPRLFDELKESDDYANVPPAQRRFQSAAELIADTPVFWRNRVLPRLERELLGIYQFLARPYPNGPNAYIDAVEANIARIEKSLKNAGRRETPSLG